MTNLFFKFDLINFEFRFKRNKYERLVGEDLDENSNLEKELIYILKITTRIKAKK